MAKGASTMKKLTPMKIKLKELQNTKIKIYGTSLNFFHYVSVLFEIKIFFIRSSIYSLDNC